MKAPRDDLRCASKQNAPVLVRQSYGNRPKRAHWRYGLERCLMAVGHDGEHRYPSEVKA